MSETFTGETNVTERCLVSEWGEYRTAGRRTSYQYFSAMMSLYAMDLFRTGNAAGDFYARVSFTFCPSPKTAHATVPAFRSVS